MKYVMIRAKHGSLEALYPVIFPNNLVHETIATAVVEALRKENPKAEYNIDSAGETQAFTTSCSGGSTTLQISSEPERDQSIINTADYSGCFV